MILWFLLLFFPFSSLCHCQGRERVAVWVFGCCSRSIHLLHLVPRRLPPTWGVFIDRLFSRIFLSICYDFFFSLDFPLLPFSGRWWQTEETEGRRRLEEKQRKQNEKTKKKGQERKQVFCLFFFFLFSKQVAIAFIWIFQLLLPLV